MAEQPQDREDGEQPPPGLEATPQAEQEPPVLPQSPGSRDQQTQTERGGSPEAEAEARAQADLACHTYLASDTNLIDAAINAVKARLGERDSVIRNAWVLTEIDHWDWEKERLVLLTNSNLIVVKYNFVRSVVQELKFIPLKHVLSLTYGDFKYTSSIVYSRIGKGIKICWGREDLVGFSARWNPFSTTTQIPYTIFASHVLVRKGKLDDPRLLVDDAVYDIEQAVQDAKRAAVSSGQQTAPPSAEATEEFRIQEAEIVCDTYFGFTALLHNRSNLGFFKRTGLASW